MTDRLSSCDDHMDVGRLPADLRTTGLPASLLDRAPHVEERDGQAVWVCDGKVWGHNAFDRAGIHDPSARRLAVAELRLADMDRGVEEDPLKPRCHVESGGCESE